MQEGGTEEEAHLFLFALVKGKTEDFFITTTKN